jgi:hypothetical protein
MTATTNASPAEEDQRASTPQEQAKAWLRLLLAMTVPALWLLIGISLTR